MTMRHSPIILAGVVSSPCGAASVMAADALTPLDIRQVKVGGEIGRRTDVTIPLLARSVILPVPSNLSQDQEKTAISVFREAHAEATQA